jgi:uncharacterized protein
MDAIVVMAKAPQPGTVKTRLSPPLDPCEASFLYSQFLLDKIEQLKRIRGPRRYIAYTPDTARTFFASITPDDFDLIPQAGRDLGERMAGIARAFFSEGFDKLLIIDSDTPNLPPRYIREGLHRLDHADVVIGPCDDGGYYLIGTRRNMPELFSGIPWSTSAVAGMTAATAVRLGVTVSLLEWWYDIDTAGDLLRLKADLDSPRNRNGFFCAHTYRALNKLL